MRFKPGNVIILPRAWAEVLIIDRDSKEVVWRYRGGYKQGLIVPHEAHLIAKGLPGAGNLLVFDNGSKRSRPYSIALEINPQTKEVVWSYEDGTNFFSSAAGSLQRLPNGNTLLSEDVHGRVFEVTPGGKIVWELKSRHRTSRVRRFPYSYCSRLRAASERPAE